MPSVYVDMVLLPRNGWSYSELKRLSMAERYTLDKLMDYEAMYRK